MIFKTPLVTFGAIACALQAFALTTDHFVTEKQAKGDFCLFANGRAANILTDTNDWPGVTRAAQDLHIDIQRVSGSSAKIFTDRKKAGPTSVIIGTAGKSDIIDQLIRQKKIDASSITGKWESFVIQTVANPLPGIKSALVICGSDKRGTIYGIYDISEQMGVSPWYFFADVPPAHHKALFVHPGKYVQGPPAVKYRGIFINDESPDLTGWVKTNYTTYNHSFYTNVFELLLRLRGNYLWPAMWDNCFNADDPLNYQLADEYGIVMGTSHVEPMMRADKEWGRAGFKAREWNFQTHSNELSKFWRDGLVRNRNDENVITIAMRGKIDTPMSPTANVALLEEIVAAQRGIIADVYHTNAAAVPQLWALYKEVQEYYEKGMRVPDDVTLLWCDDNWGNLRRVPPPEDRHRAGGAGIYYHFDYVGDPRNYKWVNSVSIPRMQEQMNIAHAYGANQIWIANVGHLLHVQLPAEFFLTFAWNPEKWPGEKVSEFTRLWAEREFGAQFAKPIADIALAFTKNNMRRKPELLSPDTFSLVNYNEAERVVEDWKNLAATADKISMELPAERRDAFFELILYPVKACANLNELYVAAAKNQLYATQERASANDYATNVEALFQTDADLSRYYNHTLAGSKWNHAMDQTHIGYRFWQQPRRNTMPRVTKVEVPDTAEMAVVVEGDTNVWQSATNRIVLPAFDRFNRPTRYIDVFNQGKEPFQFSVTSGAPWISVDANGGKVGKEQRIHVSVDWKSVPIGTTNGLVTITSGTNPIPVKIIVFNPETPSSGSFSGFVEADGVVSMEASHYTSKRDVSSASWKQIDGLGNTLAGMTVFPVTAPSITPPENLPSLEYKMYLFHAGKFQLHTTIAPTLNFVAGRGLRFAVSWDDAPPQVITAVSADYSVNGTDANRDWATTVSNNARDVVTDFELTAAGEHTLKFWMVDPGVVLEKLVIDTGGLKPSYLGPPESFRMGNPPETQVSSR
jgi:hypothetical protein